jgi:hypothetical protein
MTPSRIVFLPELFFFFNRGDDFSTWRSIVGQSVSKTITTRWHMTNRQSLALARTVPTDEVRRASCLAETVHGPYQSYGTTLTVDRREDGLWWHAEANVLSANLKPIPYWGLSNPERKAAERVVRELLAGVGSHDREEVRWDSKSIHLFRSVTFEEELQCDWRSRSAEGS